MHRLGFLSEDIDELITRIRNNNNIVIKSIFSHLAGSDTPELTDFAKKLEKTTLDTIEAGIMTGDLAKIAEPKAKEVLDSWQFIDAIADRLAK